MSTAHRPHARLRRPALALLVVSLLSLLWPPLQPRAEWPTIDYGTLPEGWIEQDWYWIRLEQCQRTGRDGYAAKSYAGDLVYAGEEMVCSGAELRVSPDGDLWAGFAERKTTGVEPVTLLDGRTVEPQVKVTEGEFHGFRSVVVEITSGYPSYSANDTWIGGAFLMRRYTCFQTEPGAYCTVVTEVFSGNTNPTGALGESPEKEACDGLVAQADAWKERWKIAGPERVERNLTVTGYNGEDTVHMPLTFVVRAEENGLPLAHEPVGFRFLGDVRCLADQYAVWSGEPKRWDWVSQSLAVEETLQAATDAQGDLILRAVVDFDRLRLDGKKLPCTIRLEAAVAAQPGDTSFLVHQSTEVTLRHPVFLRDVFFYAGTDPTGTSRSIRLHLLRQLPYSQYVTSGYGGLSAPVPGAGQVGLPEGYSRQEMGAAYPEVQDVLDRVSLIDPDSLSEIKSYVPPAIETDYYYPLEGGTGLIVSLDHNRYCGRCLASMRAGDQIAVALLWADGVQGLFSVRQVEGQASGQIGALRLGDGSAYGAEGGGNQAWTRFVIGQGTDALIKAGLGAGAKALGGPVAGGFTAVVTGGFQTTSDVFEALGIIDSPIKLVTYRSEASLTSNPDGSMTLYTFSGSPSVTDDAGNEVYAGEGEGVTFQVDGPVQPPIVQEPPAPAMEMRNALAQEAGPYAGAVQPAPDAGIAPGAVDGESATEALPDPGIGAEVPAPPPSEPPRATPWGLILGGGLGLLGGGAAVVLARRSRTKRATSLPGARQAGAPAPLAPRAASWRGRAASPAAPAPVAQRPDATTAFCPKCGNLVRPEGGFCGACGAQVAPLRPKGAVAPAVQGAVEPEDTTPNCPYCGREVGTAARFCGSCGRPLG